MENKRRGALQLRQSQTLLSRRDRMPPGRIVTNVFCVLLRQKFARLHNMTYTLCTMRCFLLVFPLVFLACVTSASYMDISPAEVALPAPPDTASEAPVAPPEDHTPLVVTRSMLRATVERGLGAFLSYVTVSPVLNRGRFVGFRLDSVHSLARLNAAGIDLRIGDVVMRVNGQSIERPEYAQRVFQEIAERDDVVIEVLRRSTPTVVRVSLTPDVQPPTVSSTPTVSVTAVR
jgi:hypothetical protein